MDIADIFREHGDAYRASHVLTPEQSKVMRAIESCRTPARGGNVAVCNHCARQELFYRSCGNRHCPKCQSLRQAKWVAERGERVLPTHHFHVVFTLPEELRPLALCNPELLYKIMFSAASQTLLVLGKDEQRLGGVPGITAVLHSWTRSLSYHPHVHCIVTGGGLSLDDARWIPTSKSFLFPVDVMRVLFRGKVLDAVSRAYKQGKLRLSGTCADLADPACFERLKSKLYEKSWVVYSKPPFAGTDQVFQYLGRYTHRVGISNPRILSADDDAVRFLTKNGKTCTLSPTEFIRRFLLHVLPSGFTKIRHFGLYAPANVRTRLRTARNLLDPSTCSSSSNPAAAVVTGMVTDATDANEPPPPSSWQALFLTITGIDLSRCKACGVGQMLYYQMPPGTGPP